MKGRKPKPQKTRQRRNKAPSAAILSTESEAAQLGAKVPPLPTKNGDWTAEAKAAWKRIWNAPMAARYLKADIFRLEILIDLVDRYWRGDTALAAQIRLEGDSFATSPLARRRLEWEVRDPTTDAEAPQKVAAAASARPKIDPRKVLTFDGGRS